MKIYVSFYTTDIGGPAPFAVWPYKPNAVKPDERLLCVVIPDDAVSKLFEVQTVQGQVNSQEKQDGR